MDNPRSYEFLEIKKVDSISNSKHGSKINDSIIPIINITTHRLLTTLNDENYLPVGDDFYLFSKKNFLIYNKFTKLKPKKIEFYFKKAQPRLAEKIWNA